MNVLVCGGRHFDNEDRVFRELDRINSESPITRLIQGGATGADDLAYQWGKQHAEIALEVYPAHWGVDGRAAGPKRNQRMLDKGEPDLVVAFPGGRGTADMVKRAKAANIKVIEVKA